MAANTRRLRFKGDVYRGADGKRLIAVAEGDIIVVTIAKARQLQKDFPKDWVDLSEESEEDDLGIRDLTDTEVATGITEEDVQAMSRDDLLNLCNEHNIDRRGRRNVTGLQEVVLNWLTEQSSGDA